MSFRLIDFSSVGRSLLLGLSVLLFSFVVLRKTPAEQVKVYYSRHLRDFHAALTHFQERTYSADTVALRREFAACRQQYKQLEFAVEYYYPHAAGRINGAALPETEPGEPGEVIPPSGFQVLEEYVYAAPDSRPNRDLIHQEIDNLLFQVRQLKQQESYLSFSDEAVFDALRLNLYRLAAKGVSGFDSPAAHASLPEATATLQATREVLALYDVPATLTTHLRRCEAAVASPNQDFNSFDRARFFVRYFNPALAALHQTQQQLRIPFVKERRAVRPEAASFFVAGAFNASFFAPADAAAPTPAMLALGEALFKEPVLSGKAGRSCASCHAPNRAYTDGLRVNSSLLADAGLERNTPTLLNAALQPDQFYDSRVHFLEDQVHAVISNKAEMGGQLSAAPALLRKKGAYPKLFAQAFATEKQPLTERNIRRAVAAYVRSLVGLNSRFDQYLRGDTTVLSGQEVLGFNLFMGKAQCGTCHYMPLFNGTVPPLYDKIESEILGVPATADTLHPTLDADQGKFLLYGVAHQKHAFKTPTVRNTARTAPYMHNGVYQTLEQVLDFYNKGGGAGLGLTVPNQTLAEDRLNLSAAEQQAIIAFLKALNDSQAVAY
ncbi:cytochrome C peroxidase [Hymenobacter sp. BT186]|uniref:Cytochrome C peroxidase n=1 Tax=Hymenobacter telluris TaxID=2816474 RepID=A0A939JER4_9BACT|nr:cytochrome c peroxidase [Hymenobacter telluris]MBO0359667.1 cytochrome C peroxidase [Hymenobacter telluris]MBW3375694.1 cytochrome C peroxidase [Hymenobacter norwichensis]